MSKSGSHEPHLTILKTCTVPCGCVMEMTHRANRICGFNREKPQAFTLTEPFGSPPSPRPIRSRKLIAIEMPGLKRGYAQ